MYMYISYFFIFFDHHEMVKPQHMTWYAQIKVKEFTRIIGYRCFFMKFYFEQLCHLSWSLLLTLSDKSDSNCIKNYVFSV